MSDMSNFLENEVVNVFFRGSSYTGGQLWVALYTASPGEGGTGTEPSGWYARQTTGATPSSAWVAPSNGLTSNAATLTWAAVTGSASTIVSVGVLTALTGGNLLVYKDLTSSVTYNVTDIPIIQVGGLQVTFA